MCPTSLPPCMESMRRPCLPSLSQHGTAGSVLNTFGVPQVPRLGFAWAFEKGGSCGQWQPGGFS